MDPGNTEVIQSLHTMSASWGRCASMDNHRIIRIKKEMTRYIQVSAVQEVLSAQKENTYLASGDGALGGLTLS